MAARKPIDFDRLADDLASTDPAVVEGAVQSMRRRLGGLSDTDYRRAVEALCSLFYVDTADRPDLEEAVELSAALLAEEGGRVVPILIAQMQGSDLKSHTHLARTLGKIGPGALTQLRNLLATAEDPYSRSFALYALGKMVCPDLVRALPEVLGGLMHPDKEVRDSAARTLGKIARAAPPRRLTPRRRREMFEALLRATGDPQPPVRAKAMRSLGKMVAAGLLNPVQKKTLATAARAALGESEEYSWDNAFIVRREARETLGHLVSPDDRPTLRGRKSTRIRRIATRARTLGVRSIVTALACLGLWVSAPRSAAAHCDTMDGPVVMTAKAALESGDVRPVLNWIKKEHEGEVRDAFAKTLAVRKLGATGKDLADRYFFELLVRLHREVEGAPYPGLKPAGTDPGPAVSEAERALQNGSDEDLLKLITEEVAAG